MNFHNVVTLQGRLKTKSLNSFWTDMHITSFVFASTFFLHACLSMKCHVVHLTWPAPVCYQMYSTIFPPMPIPKVICLQISRTNATQGFDLLIFSFVLWSTCMHYSSHVCTRLCIVVRVSSFFWRFFDIQLTHSNPNVFHLKRVFMLLLLLFDEAIVVFQTIVLCLSVFRW